MNIKCNQEGEAHPLLLLAIKHNKTTDLEWLCKLADRGTLKITSDILRELVPLLFTIYGENWDFRFEEIRPYESKPYFILHLIIRYPEIEVLNSRGNSHTIRELYVTFGIRSDAIGLVILDSINGGRMRLKEDEWSSGYMHSHLTSQHLRNFRAVGVTSGFCLGRSELGDLKMMISNATFDKGTMELFFNTLEGYVRWESLEGVPYTHMSRIVSSANVHINDMHSVAIINSVPKREIKFNLKKGRSGYEVKIDNTLEESLKPFISDTTMVGYEMDDKWVTPYTSAKGTKDTMNNRDMKIGNFMSKRREIPFTIIQGKKYEFSIDPVIEDQEVDLDKLRVKPVYLKKIKYEIERRIKEQEVRRNIIDSRVDLGYAKTIPGESEVLM